MVKIREKKQYSLSEYARAVEIGKKQIDTFMSKIPEAITEATIQSECYQFCEGWTYDPDLKACVDPKEVYYNSLISIREGEVNVTSVKSVPNKDTFRGTWGTWLTSDDKIDTHSDNAQTIKGQDPNPVGRQQTPETRPIERKTLRLKL